MYNHIEVTGNKKELTEENFWFDTMFDYPEVATATYGIPYKHWDEGKTVTAMFNIYPVEVENKKVIIFTDKEKNKSFWANLTEHNYLVNLITQYKTAKSFTFGYICGRYSPFGATKGLQSASLNIGYHFWVELYF